MPLAALAKTVGLPKSTILRLLRSLERRNLVVRGVQGESSLGIGVLVLSAAFHGHLDLRRRSVPHLRWLRDATGETSSLQVAVGMELTCIERVESKFELKWVTEIGRRWPLCSGAAGKVLVGCLPQAQRDAILRGVKLPRLTGRSIADRRRFGHVLDGVRAQGYAVSVDETVMGAAGIAAPVWNGDGRVVAALAIAGPSSRFAPKHIRPLAKAAVAAAQALSSELRGLTARSDAADGPSP
jgi:DNA-binding IclR family transcriptional regulator